MANTLKINRAHIVLALCLPAAILIGYLLTDPMPQQSSMGVIVLVLGLLCLPLWMRWYHVFLIVSLNAVFQFSFLPGTPPFWLLATAIGFSIAVLNRCVDSNRRLMLGGGVAWSLVLLAVIIFLTAYFRGGAGLAILGGSSYGGRRYVYVMAGIAAYFVLASQPVPESRRNLYAILFFLSSATSVFSFLVEYGGSKFSFLTLIVAPHFDPGESSALSNERLASLAGICNAGLFCMLVRYGVQGLLSKFWRLALTILFLTGALLTGFRSTFGFMALVLLIAFFVEGLHRTRYVLITAGIGLTCFGLVALLSEQMPWQMQRTLSFLPVRVNAAVREDAQASLDWRVDMWKVVVDQVPQYLLAGKGYALDPGDMYMSEVNSYTKLAADSSEWAQYSGDYHNGPLSLVIPFGIWGMAAFIWFLTATGYMLYYNHRYGDEALKTLNGVVFAYFMAKVLFYFILVGSFYNDLISFTSLAGLAICLNGERVSRVQREISPVLTLTTQRIARDL